MPSHAVNRERHLGRRIGWLRAAVLGANDGILSTASLIVGVASSSATTVSILVAGTAGLVAGSMSMAAGEYVSVSSQSDTEKADLAREAQELRDDPVAEQQELAQIYVERGLSQDLADQVAVQLTSADALAAHARDELGLWEGTTSRPMQAAYASALSFAVGAALPLFTVVVIPRDIVVPAVFASSLMFLMLLGTLGALIGGANPVRGAARVAFWGTAAMALTAGIGAMFGSAML